MSKSPGDSPLDETVDSMPSDPAATVTAMGGGIGSNDNTVPEGTASITVDIGFMDSTDYIEERFKGVKDGSEVVAQLKDWQPSITSEKGRPRYQLQTLLGMGGQGFVFNVLDHDCGRAVALKTLRSTKGIASRVLRFIHEAQVTAQLEHPGVIPVHDLGLLPDGTVYYTMKRVQGKTLDDIIKEAAGSPDKRFELLQIFLRICDTMSFAHARGVIHRDLKPANIMVGDYGEVLVLDWGLSKLTDGNDVIETLRHQTIEYSENNNSSSSRTKSDAFLTRAGHAVGTPAYMSPEQACGRNTDVHTPSDIFALGVILYEMIAGESPYQSGTGEEVMSQVGKGEWSQLSDRSYLQVPRELAAIVDKSMAYEITRRYQSVGELADDIRGYLANRSVSAYNESLSETLGRWYRRNRAVVNSLLLAFMVVAALIGAWQFMVHQQQQDRISALRQDAQMSLLQGDFAQARRQYEQVLVFEPNNSEVRQTLVQVEVQLERQNVEELRKQEIIAVQELILQVKDSVSSADLDELSRLKEACTQALGKLPAGSAEEIRSEVLALRDSISDRESALIDEFAQKSALQSLGEVRIFMQNGSLTEAEIHLVRIEEILPQHPEVKEVRAALTALGIAEQEANRAANGRELLVSAQNALDEGTPTNAIGLVDAALRILPPNADEIRQGALIFRDQAVAERNRLATAALQSAMRERETQARTYLANKELSKAARVVATMREEQADWPGLAQLEVSLQRAFEIRQQEQRNNESAALLQQASQLADEQQSLTQELTVAIGSVVSARQSLAADVSNDKLRESLYLLEKGVEQKQRNIAEVQSGRIEKLLQAQGLTGNNPAVRKALASFYAESVRVQEAQGNTNEAAAAAAQGAIYDDAGTYAELFQRARNGGAAVWSTGTSPAVRT